MALVRDPYFWKRFSAAVHKQEVADAEANPETKPEAQAQPETTEPEKIIDQKELKKMEKERKEKQKAKEKQKKKEEEYEPIHPPFTVIQPKTLLTKTHQRIVALARTQEAQTQSPRRLHDLHAHIVPCGRWRGGLVAQ
ncbi:uncharacterized protein PFLUO_LOCUS3442 [Penicillium psychrofluorescens]|uniref:uncharacterized protein n=1 Tax=Penicillium psychrofluorescens TaxID=3158075 RepID=UPI003CCD5E71